MPDTLIYPEARTLSLIDQEYIADAQLEDDVFKLFPIVTEDTWRIMWEQLDNFRGLQAVRGLNGEPPVVKPVGLRQFEMEPGVYGEAAEITEDQIARRRRPGTFGDHIDISDLTTERSLQLTIREVQRIKLNLWTLLGSGVFSVYGENGALMHKDAYTFQSYTPSPLWTDLANSFPLKDIRAARAAWVPGYSVRFGVDALMYMNSHTFNTLMANTNDADLGGKKGMYGANFLDMEAVNKVLLTNDLPQIVIYDEGYYPDSGSFTKFIPNGKVIVIGQRVNGQRIGEYVMGRNPGNPQSEPGPYLMVTDSLDTGRPIPRKLRIDKGHVGGPRFLYPSAVGVINAY